MEDPGNLQQLVQPTIPRPPVAVSQWLGLDARDRETGHPLASEPKNRPLTKKRPVRPKHLSSVNVSLADLPTGQLGQAWGNTITLDYNANGAGWKVGTNSLGTGRVDLLTVVNHEMGHLLGYGRSTDTFDVMAATLPIGTRRLPGAAPETTHAPRQLQRVSPLLPESYESGLQSDLVDDTLLASEAGETATLPSTHGSFPRRRQTTWNNH